jgi:hypothetical protein
LILNLLLYCLESRVVINWVKRISHLSISHMHRGVTLRVRLRCYIISLKVISYLLLDWMTHPPVEILRDLREWAATHADVVMLLCLLSLQKINLDCFIGFISLLVSVLLVIWQ